MEITGSILSCSPDIATTNFYPFGRFKKDLAGKRFAVDADVKQAVTFCRDTCHAFLLRRHANHKAFVTKMLICE